MFQNSKSYIVGLFILCASLKPIFAQTVYVDSLRAYISKFVEFNPNNLSSNPSTKILLEMDEMGRITQKKVIHFDNKSWNDAILDAFEKIDYLPVQFFSSIPKSIQLNLQPRELLTSLIDKKTLPKPLVKFDSEKIEFQKFPFDNYFEWLEIDKSTGKYKFHFKEISKNDSYYYLFDSSRNIYLALPQKGGQSFFTDSKGNSVRNFIIISNNLLPNIKPDEPVNNYLNSTVVNDKSTDYLGNNKKNTESITNNVSALGETAQIAQKNNQQSNYNERQKGIDSLNCEAYAKNSTANQQAAAPPGPAGLATFFAILAQDALINMNTQDYYDSCMKRLGY